MRSFLGIICILVICILNIASVHKNLHDLICSDSYSDSCGFSNSNCSSNAADGCNSNSADSEGKTCDSIYCAVNIFSNGYLVLDFALLLTDKISIEVDPVIEHLVSHFSEEEKSKYFVRGPPDSIQA